MGLFINALFDDAFTDTSYTGQKVTNNTSWVVRLPDGKERIVERYLKKSQGLFYFS